MWYKTLVYIGSVLLSNSNFGSFSWVNNVKCQNRESEKDGGEVEKEDGEERRDTDKVITELCIMYYIVNNLNFQ